MKRRKIWTMIILLTLLFIWGHSCVPADTSGAESSFWAVYLNKVLKGLRLSWQIKDDFYLRKFAHMWEYGVLGLEISLGYQGIKEKFRRGSFGIFLLTGLVAAFADETIQLFVPGRSGEIRDVWIDLAGFTIGVILVTLGTMRSEKKHNRQNLHIVNKIEK